MHVNKAVHDAFLSSHRRRKHDRHRIPPNNGTPPQSRHDLFLPSCANRSKVDGFDGNCRTNPSNPARFAR
jgi:hypothetical protein